jgi:hypothetical protein
MKNNRGLWIGLGVALALCACAVVVGILVLRSGFQRMTAGFEDPAAMSEIGERIADFDLPAGYELKGGMDLFVYRLLVIAPTGDANDGMFIMLFQFDQLGTEEEREQIEQQMRQSFQQQSGQTEVDWDVVETRTITIRGEETEVTVSRGSDESGVVFRQWMAVFPAKSGTGMVMIQGLEREFDDQVAEDFLESLR